MNAPSDHGWAASPAPTPIDSRDLRPGDVVVFLGEHHVIDRIEPYTGPTVGIFACAYAANGWGIALTDTVPITIAHRPARKDARP